MVTFPFLNTFSSIHGPAVGFSNLSACMLFLELYILFSKQFLLVHITLDVLKRGHASPPLFSPDISSSG